MRERLGHCVFQTMTLRLVGGNLTAFTDVCGDRAEVEVVSRSGHPIEVCVLHAREEERMKALKAAHEAEGGRTS